MSKKDFSKKDMNFFSEFTASSQRTTKTIIAAAFGVVGVIVICALVCLGLAITYWGLKANVQAYQVKFASEEYANLDITSQNLAQSLASRNEQLYALSSMRYNVDSSKNASVAVADAIAAAVPSDTILTDYDITGSIVTIGADTFSYYSQVEMINRLQQTELFASVQITGSRNAMPSFQDAWESYVMNADYHFSVTAILNGMYVVSVARLSQAGIVFTPYENSVVKGGAVFSLDDVSTYSYDGIEYQLTSILLNGSAVSPEQLSEIFNNNNFSMVVGGDCKVQFYYEDPAVLAAAEG